MVAAFDFVVGIALAGGIAHVNRRDESDPSSTSPSVSMCEARRHSNRLRSGSVERWPRSALNATVQALAAFSGIVIGDACERLYSAFKLVFPATIDVMPRAGCKAPRISASADRGLHGVRIDSRTHAGDPSPCATPSRTHSPLFKATELPTDQVFGAQIGIINIPLLYLPSMLLMIYGL